MYPGLACALCECGQAEQSSHHLLLECPLLERARTALLKPVALVEVSQMLATPEACKAVLEFAKQTGLGFVENLQIGRDHEEENESDNCSEMSDMADEPYGFDVLAKR